MKDHILNKLKEGLQELYQAFNLPAPPDMDKVNYLLAAVRKRFYDEQIF